MNSTSAMASQISIYKMAPLLTVFLLASASTLLMSSQVLAVVNKGIVSDLSTFDSALVKTVEEFDTAETLLDGYLNRHSYPADSTGCVGVLSILSVKLNDCRNTGDGYQKTVATSTSITTTSYSSNGCLTVTSTAKKSYTAGVCSAQILYSISKQVTSDLTVPRVTRRSDYYHRCR